MQVMLNEQQTQDLKNYIFTITNESIEEAKKNAGLNTPFLKQVHLSKWLGISVNTIKEWEKKGMPSIYIDGVKLFSKKEVSNWILQYQK